MYLSDPKIVCTNQNDDKRAIPMMSMLFLIFFVSSWHYIPVVTPIPTYLPTSQIRQVRMPYGLISMDNIHTNLPTELPTMQPGYRCTAKNFLVLVIDRSAGWSPPSRANPQVPAGASSGSLSNCWAPNAPRPPVPLRHTAYQAPGAAAHNPQPRTLARKRSSRCL